MPEDKFSMLSLGDSYTIGESVQPKDNFPSQLKNKLASLGYTVNDPEVIAKTGWTTTNLIKEIEENPPTEDQYSLVTLLIGVNNQYQNKPINLYKKDFQFLCEASLKYAANNPKRVIVLSIPDYSFTIFGKDRDPEQISLEISLYNQINQEIARNFHFNYVDITDITKRGLLEPLLIAKDGLHPSSEMYSKWIERILDLKIFN